MRDDFCVVILTHGRPDRVMTLRAIERGGYAGPVYLVVDNEDEKAQQYHDRYGGMVIEFDKTKAAEITDPGDNRIDHSGVVYARNAIFGIVQTLGYKYFLVLDDDYDQVAYRFDDRLSWTFRNCTNLDRLFELVVQYLEETPAKSVAFSQAGDAIGGPKGGMGTKIWMKRKAMNTFFCSVDRPWKCYGRINEDMTAYVLNGSRGDLFFQLNQIRINQQETQHNPGGLSEIYLALGTYVKSFYSVMYCPSFVSVSVLGHRHHRLHHRISWNNAVPKILRESCRKQRAE